MGRCLGMTSSHYLRAGTGMATLQFAVRLYCRGELITVLRQKLLVVQTVCWGRRYAFLSQVAGLRPKHCVCLVSEGKLSARTNTVRVKMTANLLFYFVSIAAIVATLFRVLHILNQD